MSVEAAVALYRSQFVASFEQRVSKLRATTTKETMSNGLTVTFLVSGSGGDTAVTRGVNGQIPYGNPTNTQITATLVEKHAPYELTNFNIFASQGDQKRIMQEASMAVINRDIDDEIIGALSTGTVNTGTAVTGSMALISKAKALLGRADVDLSDENNIFGLISPSMHAYLEQTTQWASGDYRDVKPLAGPTRQFYRWHGINWIVSNRVSGVGTNAEKCLLWHRSAIGYAVNVGEDKVAIGYDEKQDSSWSRATIYHAAKVLQNAGIVVMNHDGSAHA